MAKTVSKVAAPLSKRSWLAGWVLRPLCSYEVHSLLLPTQIATTKRKALPLCGGQTLWTQCFDIYIYIGILHIYLLSNMTGNQGHLSTSPVYTTSTQPRCFSLPTAPGEVREGLGPNRAATLAGSRVATRLPWPSLQANIIMVGSRHIKHQKKVHGIPYPNPSYFIDLIPTSSPFKKIENSPVFSHLSPVARVWPGKGTVETKTTQGFVGFVARLRFQHLRGRQTSSTQFESQT